MVVVALAKPPLPVATSAPSTHAGEGDYVFTDGAVFPAQPYWVFDGLADVIWTDGHFNHGGRKLVD